MALDAESVIDRRRLKRRLTAWRIAAVVLGLLFLGVLLLSDQNVGGPGRYLAPCRAGDRVRHHHRRPQDELELIDKVAKSDQVKAVIIDINSPGGTTTGGEAMYDAVRRLAEKKPVVAVCGTLATSAAYIVALASDRIFVYGNTITGSVGVIFQWAEVTELLHTLGIKVEEVKSGPLKAVPSPFEPTDEQRPRVDRGDGAGRQGLVRRPRQRSPQDRGELRPGPDRRPHLFRPAGRGAEARRPDRRRDRRR